MCLLGIVERPGVSWGVLGCPGVIRLTRQIAARVLSLPIISHTIWPDLTFNMHTVSNFVRQLPFIKLHIILGPGVRKVNIACHS